MNDPRDPASSYSSGRRTSWSSILLGVAVIGPALALGGVHHATLFGFVAVLGLLWARLVLRRSAKGLRMPIAASIGLFCAGLTALQCLPIPGLRGLVAPELQTRVDEALQGTGVAAWPSLSVVPGDTAFEAARLLALSLLVIAAAALSWRASAGAIAAGGTIVACIGLTQEALGVEAIYGFYHARDVELSSMPSLLTTFVNPNHQSGFFLLGWFCAVALASDQYERSRTAGDPTRADRHRERFLAALAAVVIQVAALALSLSRGGIGTWLLVAPLAAWFAFRPAARRRADPPRRGGPKFGWAVQLALVLAIGGTFALAAKGGAWRELSTIFDVLGDELDEKIRVAIEGPALIPMSPWLGIGRGAFGDLFAGIDSEASHIVVVHLETAPLAMLVEWGVPLGGLLVLALPVWWCFAFVQAGKEPDRARRRIALLGLLALALQSLTDFSLAYLGVAAPACALAGGLSPDHRSDRWWSARASRWIGALGLGSALLVAAIAMPYVRGRREATYAALAQGADPGPALRFTPLDAKLHRVLARLASDPDSGAPDWPAALRRAEVATTLRPGDIDGWLLRSAAERALGRPLDADVSLRRGLETLHPPVPDALIDYLLTTYPDPDELARLSPDDREAWQWLVSALRKRSLDHADAVAAGFARRHPDDPEPLRLRASMALERGHPGLALHHARLFHQLAPDDPQASLATARALRSFRPPRLYEARDRLEDGLNAALLQPAVRAEIEELLIATLIELGRPEDLTRAKVLLPTLQRRPADAETRRRRAALAAELHSRSDTD